MRYQTALRPEPIIVGDGTSRAELGLLSLATIVLDAASKMLVFGRCPIGAQA